MNPMRAHSIFQWKHTRRYDRNIFNPFFSSTCSPSHGGNLKRELFWSSTTGSPTTAPNMEHSVHRTSLPLTKPTRAHSIVPMEAPTEAHSNFNSSFSSTLNASFSSTLNMSVENSIIVRDGELHGVHHCSDTAAENWAKIDREAREDS